MTILKISNFGGEIPRLPSTALPPNAAQVNSNLLATATEFRPLQSDATVSTAPPGAQTLYRLSKDATGVIRQSDTEGWIAEVAHKSYVKGQINDDGTERTYVTFNDGTQKPRAIDALGQNRLMGVPAPFYATAVLEQGESFTLSEAVAWADATLAPAVHTTALMMLPEVSPATQLSARVAGGKPVAGAFSLYSMAQSTSDPWLAHRAVALSSALTGGLNDPLIGATTVGSNLLIPVMCLPYWAKADSRNMTPADAS